MAQSFGVETDQTFFEKIKIFEAEVLKIINNGKGDTAGRPVCNDQQKEMCEYEYGEYFDWACKNCK